LPVFLVGDEVLQEWHARAKAGDGAALDKLFLWTYCEANRYYGHMTEEVSRLTVQDAEDLAAQFVLEFESVWRDVRSVTRYTRVVLKRNLYRHLAALSNGPKAVSLDVLETRDHSVSQTHAPWMTFSDAAFDLYDALCTEYYELPIVNRILINARLRNPPTPYGAVCRVLGLDEANARVFTNRFLKRVRQRWRRRGGH
jgi:hypothetical protein